MTEPTTALREAFSKCPRLTLVTHHHFSTTSLWWVYPAPGSADLMAGVATQKGQLQSWPSDKPNEWVHGICHLVSELRQLRQPRKMPQMETNKTQERKQQS